MRRNRQGANVPRIIFIILCILAPIAGFFSAYPIIQLFRHIFNMG